MNALLRARVGVRPLAALIAALDVLWLVSVWSVAENSKGGHLSLFWIGVLIIGPFVGVLFSGILFWVQLGSDRRHLAWSIVGVLAGVAPICWWLAGWLFR